MSWDADSELVESLARRVMLIAMEHDVKIKVVSIELVDALEFAEAWIMFDFSDSERGKLGVRIKRSHMYLAERINAKFHEQMPRIRPLYG